MYKNEQKNEDNFWISYADLMAGLLFVFILVIGAIVIRYLYTQKTLENEKLALSQSQEALINKNEVLSKLNSLLKKLEEEKTELSNQLSKSNETIQLNSVELQKLKDLLLGYELKDKEQADTNSKLSQDLANSQNQITLKDSELTVLVNKLLEQEKTHQRTVEEFDITKAKIKSLTGIKLNVITKLKQKLGNSINIDEKSGAIKFSSNILFDQGAYKLKEDSKKELNIVLKKYISTLLEDKEIRKYIYGITIEGHTNSDGSYISNLQLSQQRALEVMQFLYESNSIDKNLLNKYVSSSGKSSSDLIYNKDGSEDKDNSRRIEIKFIIKNDEAVKELQNYLGTKNE
ncbi:OmpA domain-containing protein [Arcobacter venerupis]|jgi:chemotaxis protein MotB|uniref:OmpA domain-containing protein n=1 Tax=Arcobacter venerupis TaxID=1054033 RepID=A0AAE7B901_9BACT|nr:OmpA family protein [Arcobacter venerupis]QKF66002.1 OmpA domain-containing protein [Arcobacter venerupis]RWS49359.1 chemotaxis protein [Arcobacter venerupis]